MAAWDESANDPEGNVRAEYRRERELRARGYCDRDGGPTCRPDDPRCVCRRERPPVAEPVAVLAARPTLGVIADAGPERFEVHQLRHLSSAASYEAAARAIACHEQEDDEPGPWLVVDRANGWYAVYESAAEAAPAPPADDLRGDDG